MNYCKIRKMDISNGPGVRVSIFVQGCTFNCPNCFNKETHDFEGGKPFNQETIDHILKLSEQSHIQGLSILGGEPLHPRNIDAVIELCKAFNAHFNNAKSIWVWTGYLYENIVNKDIYNHVDVIVDGIVIVSGCLARVYVIRVSHGAYEMKFVVISIAYRAVNI